MMSSRQVDNLHAGGGVDQRAALCRASGQSFSNTSPFRLRDLRASAKQHRRKADFEVFSSGAFRFMLGHSPHGKSWRSGLEPTVTGRVE